MVYQDYTTPFEELLIKDGSVCIHHRNIQLVAIEMFKVKNNLCPEILKYIFQFNTNPTIKKTFLNVSSEYMGKLSLRWFGPVVWETMLPESYKSITVLEKFKEDIKKWVPDNCNCRLCQSATFFTNFLLILQENFKVDMKFFYACFVVHPIFLGDVSLPWVVFDRY